MERFLPIGSVVLLKEGKKRLMICGRIQTKVNDNIIYDYSGCYFPEGILNPDELFLFNNENIERIFYLGYQDEEEFQFRKYIEDKLQEYESKS